MSDICKIIMEEEEIKREAAVLEFGLDTALGILSTLSLTSVTIGDYLVVMRTEFDLTISGEPYIGLVLLLKISNRTYISRIWNQTVASGSVEGPDQLREVFICLNLGLGAKMECKSFSHINHKFERGENRD